MGRLAGIVLLVFIFLSDQITKYLFFAPRNSSLNTGISFGWGQHFNPVSTNVLIILFTVGTILFLFYFWWRRKISDLVFGLIAGGGISNLMDRIILGGVRDFLFLGPWRNNWADYAICLGMIIWLWQTSFDKRQKSNKIA